MNRVSVPPIGRSLNAGYSSMAGPGALRKICTGPDCTIAKTKGAASGTVTADGEPEHVAIELRCCGDVGDDEIWREFFQFVGHRTPLIVCSLMPTSTNSARASAQVGVLVGWRQTPLGTT